MPNHRLLLDQALDLLLIGFLVGLGPGAVHRRAFAAIEHPKLDARGVDRPPHRAAQGVDLADDLPLGHAADGRIAAHLGDGVQIGRQQRSARPHASGGQRRLGAGVAGADHNDVIIVLARGHKVMIRDALPAGRPGALFREGEAPAEPGVSRAARLGRSLALPALAPDGSAEPRPPALAPMH